MFFEICAKIKAFQAKKLHDYNRAKERQKEEHVLRQRQERVRKAQEANKRAAEASANQEVNSSFSA